MPSPAYLIALLQARADDDAETLAELRDVLADPEAAEALLEQVRGVPAAKAFRKAAAHAPAGGATIQGKEYKGGEFIPGDVMDEATDEERAAVEGDGSTALNSGSESLYQISEDAKSKFVQTGQASAYRIQDNRYPLPKESKSTWSGDESGTMGGVSGLANFSNAVEDILFGRNESVTGENYSANVYDSGGEPCVVVMDGREKDGPGAEIVVMRPKVAAVIGLAELQDAFRIAASELFDEDASQDLVFVKESSPKEVVDRYDFDSEDTEFIYKRMLQLIRRART